MVTEQLKKKQHYIFPVLDILLNGLNYLFHVYVSWYLTAEKYGELNALLSIAAVLLVTGISFQVTTARKVAAAARQDEVFKSYGSTASTVLISSLIILIPLTPVLRNLTRSSLSSVFLVIFIFCVNLALSLFRGMMQGQKRFLLLNLSFYIEVLSKTALLLLLLPRLRSINTALFTIAGGMLLALVHSLVIYRKQSRLLLKKPQFHIRKTVLSSIAAEGSSQFALYFFTSVDMIIVNYFLMQQSGEYAVVLKYCQLLFFVSFSILTVFIPHLSENGKDRVPFLRLSGLCALILSAVCGLSLLFYWLIFPPSVSYFFDVQYAGAAGYLLMGGLAYVLLVLSFMLINFMLVLDRRDFMATLLGAGILLVGILLFFHQTIRMVLLVKIAVFSVLLISLTVQFLAILKKEQVYE